MSATNTSGRWRAYYTSVSPPMSILSMCRSGTHTQTFAAETCGYHYQAKSIAKKKHEDYKQCV
eukprot:4893562-Amphidinium_carterae.1